MKKLLLVALFLNGVLLAGRFWQELPANAQEQPLATENGDLDGDGTRNVTDAVYLLRWLFQRGPAPVACAQGGGLTPEQAEILGHMSIVQVDDRRGGMTKTIRFTGVNVQIVNGLGATNGFPGDDDAVDPVQTTTNGVGNLIVGYNEDPQNGFIINYRTGSHNMVVGSRHNYTSFGGLVVGTFNEISGAYSSVSGGRFNDARGDGSSVSGGNGNKAIGSFSSVSGGGGLFPGNTAMGDFSTVSGGRGNVATEVASHVP